MQGDRVTVLVALRDEPADVERVVASLRESGVDFARTEQREVSPGIETLLAISVATHTLLHVLHTLRVTMRKGIVVDGQATEAKLVRVDEALPRGVVVVRSASGDITVREGEPLREELLSVLSRSGRRS
ncbi:MAG TPA: hypothetical protein VF529_03515 [Solirubrobacteraceae bacterium]